MMHFFRRILRGMGAILLALFLSFVLIHMAPGDPVTAFIDPSMSMADIERIRQNLGLNEPIPIQFLKWLGVVIQGNLGVSTSFHQPVLDVIIQRLFPTLLLTVTTLLCILLLTFILGVLSAWWAGSWVDRGITWLTTLGMAIPSFWLGILLMWVCSVQFNWLPASGYVDPLYSMGSLDWWVSAIQHLVLPVMAGTVGGLAVLTRYYRAGLIKELGLLYILAVKARGLSTWSVLRHALKNASLPLVTLLGMELPGLLAGSYMIESVFSWPGLGQLGVNAVFSRDYPVLMGILLASTILVVLGNALSDVMARWVDPRVRLDS